MDRLIQRFDGIRDQDLVVCEHRGVAYQADMRAGRVEYGHAYYDKVMAYEGTPIAKAVNAGRLELVRKHAAPAAMLCDFGAGTGAFVREARAAGFDAKGFEVMGAAVGELQRAQLWAETPRGFACVTFWDVLEHLEDPGRKVEALGRDTFMFASVPIFEDLGRIRGSKHYRPGEHLYYWTRDGFVAWAASYGFRLLEQSRHEVLAGREAIGAFAFKRDLPDYVDHIGLYDRMHSERHYGSSSAELHLDAIAKLVRRIQPASILDYGCGRSDLVTHFWLDGARRIARYDPAIPRFKDRPEGTFDLVLCCDVMEHIPMAGVDRFLSELKAKGTTVVFTISTKLARAKLPDGRNAHVTLLTRGEWVRWIAHYFGPVEEIASAWDHELIFLAGSARRRTRLCVDQACAGEMFLDSYRPAKRPEEWFFRCEGCGSMSRSAASKEAAELAFEEDRACAQAA